MTALVFFMLMVVAAMEWELLWAMRIVWFIAEPVSMEVAMLETHSTVQYFLLMHTMLTTEVSTLVVV